MRLGRLAWLALVPAMALAPSVVAAQDSSQSAPDPEESRRVDFSASAGGMLPTRWSDLVVLGSISSTSGVLEQVLTRDMRVEPDTQFTAAVTYWRGRYGFRTQGGFSRSSLRIGSTAIGDQALTPPNGSSVRVNTYLYDVRGAIGFLDYDPSRWIWPYGFVGVGGITYKLNQPITPPLTFIGAGPIGTNGSGNTIVTGRDGRQFVLAIDELRTETVFAFDFGVGTEFRIPVGAAGIGLKVEVGDEVSQSPLRVEVQQGSFGGLSQTSAVQFPLVHQLAATVGLVVRIGR